MFAAVIVIPLFLGDPKYEAEQETMPVISTEFESRIQPLSDSDSAQQNASNANNTEDKGLVLKKLSSPPVSTSDLPKQMDIQPLRLDEEIARVDPAAKVVKTATPATAPKPAAEKSVAKKPSAPKANTRDLKAGWVVQAGIFSKAENAVAIAGILKNNGYAPNVSNAKASFGNAKRVWIGPFASKSEAQAISRRLEQQTGNGGYVAAYPFKS